VADCPAECFLQVEAGYLTLVTKLFPPAASNKNDVLVGLPPTAFGLRAMAFLRRVAERSLREGGEHPSFAAAAVPSTTTAAADTRRGDTATAAAVNRVWGDDGYHVGVAKEAACTYFIKRKKRTCSNRAADGLSVCSLHTPVALQAERVRCKQPASTAPACTAASTAPACTAAASTAAASTAASTAAAFAAAAVTTSELGGESDAKQPRLEAEAHTGTSGGGRQHRISATQNRMRNPFARDPAAAAAAATDGGGFPFPEWREAFADVSLPVFLDVGSARGAFVEAMAKHFPQRNYLGKSAAVSPSFFLQPRALYSSFPVHQGPTLLAFEADASALNSSWRVAGVVEKHEVELRVGHASAPDAEVGCRSVALAFIL
jgi:hypothetical protein